MIARVIANNAEEAVVSVLEQAGQQNAGWGALYFEVSKLKIKPGEDDILLTARPALEGKPSNIYFLYNGDVTITWKGMQKATLEDLCHRLYERYLPKASEKLHSYFDMQAQGEELRSICRQKIAEKQKSKTAHPEEKHEKSINISGSELNFFQAAVKARKNRKQMEILIVEDQAFSRQLLSGMLGKDYHVYGAENAKQAMELYLTHAPDIMFLDIELPDGNGHNLAENIIKTDNEANIIMVTANSYPEDVMKAKNNKVKGFIAKPFNKQKILDTVRRILER